MDGIRKETMTTEQLTDFVQQELMQNIGLDETTALYEALYDFRTKVVLEGHYAVLKLMTLEVKFQMERNSLL